MLRIKIDAEEFYNETTNTFFETEEVELDLEHSLVALSKWESKFQKPFLSTANKTHEESIGYLRAMVVTPGVDLDVLERCSAETYAQVQAYIESTESATTFGQLPERRGPGEVITAELIYFWMTNFGIDIECETWHLNRLFSLIKIGVVKNNPPKKMSRKEMAERNKALNDQRRAAMNSSG